MIESEGSMNVNMISMVTTQHSSHSHTVRMRELKYADCMSQAMMRLHTQAVSHRSGDSQAAVKRGCLRSSREEGLSSGRTSRQRITKSLSEGFWKSGVGGGVVACPI